MIQNLILILHAVFYKEPIVNLLYFCLTTHVDTVWLLIIIHTERDDKSSVHRISSEEHFLLNLLISYFFAKCLWHPSKAKIGLLRPVSVCYSCLWRPQFQIRPTPLALSPCVFNVRSQRGGLGKPSEVEKSTPAFSGERVFVLRH